MAKATSTAKRPLEVAQEQGYFGVKVDPVPNSAYTVGGKGAKVFNGPNEPAEYVKANQQGSE